MKTVLIVIGALFAAFMLLFIFCALRVSSMYDRQEEAIRPIRGRDSFSRRDKLYDKVEYFNDPNFWGADNIIEPTESLDKAIERLKLRVKRQRN